MLDIIKKTAIGLGLIGGLTALIWGYAFVVTSLNLGKTLEIVLLFAPIVLYISYLWGDIRLFNCKK